MTKIGKITVQEIDEIKQDTSGRKFGIFMKTNEKFIHSIVHKMKIHSDPEAYHDLFQEASIGLWEAFSNYDTNKVTAQTGSGFSTFAWRNIYNRALQYVQKSHNPQNENETSIENFVRAGEDSDGHSEYYETMFKQKNNGFESELVKKMDYEKLMERLSPTEQKIIDLHFKQGLEHKDVAKTLGLNYHTYSKVIFTNMMKKKIAPLKQDFL